MLVVLATLLIPAPPILRAETPLSFHPLGSGRGLNAPVVPALLADHQGFLWVGSRDGLFRYDGYEALRFMPDADDPQAISDNDIRKLRQTSDGFIWVGTNTAGLNRLDPETGRFERFRHDPDDTFSLSYDSVYDMAEDPDGRLWVSTQFGLNRLDPQTGRFERFLHDPDDAGSLPVDWAMPVLVDSSGRFWVGTVGGGLARWDRRRQAFDRVDMTGATAGALPHNDVFALADSGDGQIWAGTRGGVIRVDALTLEAEALELPFEGPVIVTSLKFDAEGLLWIGTLIQGVLIHDLSSDEVRFANPDLLGSDQQIPQGSLLSIERLGDLLFVGTEGHGLFKANTRPDPFRFLAAGWDSDIISQSNVTALHVDSQTGQLWTGSFGGGLQAIDTSVLRADPPMEPIGSDAVLSIATTVDGQLFAGGMFGLWEVSRAGSVDFHAHRVDQEGSIGPGYVVSLLGADDGSLWAGVGGSGLFRRDPGAAGFRSFGSNQAGSAQLSGGFVTALLQTGANELWVGTRSNGLNHCDIEPWLCRAFSVDTDPALRHHNVTTLLADSRGRVWVGTYGGGLHRAQFDDQQHLKAFEHFGERQGLISSSVMGLLEDDDGSIWVSTRAGLSRLDPENGRSVSFVAASGLPVTHFNARAVARDESSLYFGGIGGLVAHPSGTSFSPRGHHPLRITGINWLQSERSGANLLSSIGQLRVPWNHPFSLRFAVLDFSESAHEYVYRLSPGQEWIEHGPSREITFFGLAPGFHELELRGRDAFGNWTPIESLAIEVIPPLWMNNWFRALLALALGLLILAGHLLRTRVLRDQNLVLCQLTQQREAALLEAEAGRQNLNEAYQRLQHLTHRLQSVKEEERRHISQELHDELGQTLTATKISLQLLGRDIADPATGARLADSVAMLDSTIDRVRQISFSLRPPLLDELGLTAALTQFLEGLSKCSMIPIDFLAAPAVSGNSPEVRTVAFRVVQEAVNNAIRHAHATHIRVDLDRDDEHGLRIRISDDGVGFDPEQVCKRPQVGDHLGLLGMQERLHAVNGHLSINAEPGRGCTIEARIPNL